MNITTAKVVGEISKKELYERTTPIDIMLYYLPEFVEIGKKFNSPFRKESSPSCAVWIAPTGMAFLKDFGTRESYGPEKLVMTLFNLNYHQAIEKIYREIVLGQVFNAARLKRKDSLLKKSLTKIQVKRRNLNLLDKAYWFDQYSVQGKTLLRYDVSPLSHYWINDFGIAVRQDELTYAYRFESGIYKIYTPYSEDHKWISNVSETTIQGLKQLQYEANILIITKSLKDVLVLHECGYEAVAPQCETILIKEELAKNLSNKYDKIFVLFDNDDAGIIGSKLYAEQYGYESIWLTETKDVSDLMALKGKEQTINILKNLI